MPSQGGSDMAIPRPEHPKPQFERADWLNLNGEWSFALDTGRSALDRELYLEGKELDKTITVPFCPESKLSGVEYKEFLFGCVYKRRFTVPSDWVKGVVKLHFGAVDYFSYIYINGAKVGEHKGGYVGFSFDITKYLREGENEVTVIVQDDNRDPLIPRGKQCERHYSAGCSYTRTTGIWQTVWLEYMPVVHLEGVKYYADAENAVLTAVVKASGTADFTVKASFDGADMGSASHKNAGGEFTVTLPLKEKHLWELGKGGLYDLELTFGDDTVKSYFGLRSATMSGKKFILNGKSVFQRLILDQGFYPEGVWTAPTDADLIKDIELSMAAGFNGARLHQKVFEERFLYHADRMGYMVWGEYGDWGIDNSLPESIYSILPEWIEVLNRDFNHPAIVCWCPHNEIWNSPGNGARQYDEQVATVYYATKAIDPTRPCIDTSGWKHVVTDIFDIHDYDQIPENFRKRYEVLAEGKDYPYNGGGQHAVYHNDIPFHVSEYGGIAMQCSGWGYGDKTEDAAALVERYDGLTTALLDNPDICGFCYTQLTDVEQEQNGLYLFDRTPKVDIDAIRAINTKKAAIED